MAELEREHRGDFTNYLCMDPAMFHELLQRLTPRLENAFGILANMFQCLFSMLQVWPVAAKTLVMACMTLHNLMRIRYPGLQNQVLDCEGEDNNVSHARHGETRVY